MFNVCSVSFEGIPSSEKKLSIIGGFIKIGIFANAVEIRKLLKSFGI